MSTHDHAATDRIRSRPHLRNAPQGNSAHPTDRPNEASCRVCGSRITVGPDGIEYGHCAGHTGTTERCPHRPSCVDTSSPSRWR